MCLPWYCCCALFCLSFKWIHCWVVRGVSRWQQEDFWMQSESRGTWLLEWATSNPMDKQGTLNVTMLLQVPYRASR